MSTAPSAPLLISVTRIVGGHHYVARAGTRVRLSTKSGPDAAKACAAACLDCEPDQVILSKHAPGVFKAEMAKPANPETKLP